MKASVATSLASIPGPQGERFVQALSHGSLVVELYQPVGHDGQQPHTRDEVYVVVQGHGIFVNCASSVEFHAGDVLFVAAGTVHRFEKFSNDFVTWVLFYGPEGGEG